MTTNVPTAHSLFSPSGSSRWMKCPASIKFCQQFDTEYKSNPAAEEGTAAHEFAAECLIHNLEPASQMGKEFLPGYPVDFEMASGIKEYMDVVESLMGPFHTLEVEQRIEMNDLTAGTGGTSDIVIYSPTEFHIMDLKYGRGIPVEVKNNSQLKTYCAGRIRELAQAGIIKPEELEVIRVHIFQPRCPHPDGPHRFCDVSLEELREHWRDAKIAIADALSDNPTFGPGEDQCRWCEGAAVCKKLAEFNLETAQLEFSDLATRKLDPIAANTMSKEDLANVMRHSKMFDSWIKSAVAYAQNELERGREFPGFKLVRGRANRCWTGEAETKVIDLLTELGFDKDSAYSMPKFKSPNQIEQVIGKQNSSMITDYVMKPLGKITIAPDTDKRPAVVKNASAESDFESFGDK